MCFDNTHPLHSFFDVFFRVGHTRYLAKSSRWRKKIWSWLVGIARETWISSALQCVAVCWGLLHCVAACLDLSKSYEILDWAVHCSVLQCVAVCCSVSGLVRIARNAWRFSMLQCFAVCCSVLQYVVTCCSVLQRHCGSSTRFARITRVVVKNPLHDTR